ncbi:hypothetical protein D3C75_1194980 [compost metagenome]
MGSQRLLNRTGGYPVIDPEVLVAYRRQEDRLDAGEDDGGHHRFVNVPRHDDLVPFGAGGHDHGHDRSTRPLNKEKGLICAKGLGC